jgi:hypothetical protein
MMMLIYVVFLACDESLSASGLEIHEQLLNGCCWLPSQPVNATHALNLSAGVSNCNVFLGRSFSCRAILLR